MEEKKLLERAKAAGGQFLSEEVGGICPYGSGHINDTFLVEAGKRYILQRMNRNIFTDPQGVMENILGVTNFLRDKITKAGGDGMRETLTVIPTKAGEPLYWDSQGDCWRMYHFIEDAVSYDRVESERDFYESAVAFGNFQQMLADYPARIHSYPRC